MLEDHAREPPDVQKVPAFSRHLSPNTTNKWSQNYKIKQGPISTSGLGISTSRLSGKIELEYDNLCLHNSAIHLHTCETAESAYTFKWYHAISTVTINFFFVLTRYCDVYTVKIMHTYERNSRTVATAPEYLLGMISFNMKGQRTGCP